MTQVARTACPFVSPIRAAATETAPTETKKGLIPAGVIGKLIALWHAVSVVEPLGKRLAN